MVQAMLAQLHTDYPQHCLTLIGGKEDICVSVHVDCSETVYGQAWPVLARV